jgi:hypothetical protein
MSETMDRLIQEEESQLPAQKCRWLHEKLEQLKLVDYASLKSNVRILPENGIYFFYEEGELWGHGGNKQRIVRVGTSRDGNFRSRIGEHYLLNDSKMNFGKDNPKPSDRSIFRKNIGRALLNRDGDSYLDTWNKDFTERKNKDKFAQRRDIAKEREIEARISEVLRNRFSFRFIKLSGETRRMGKTGLESPLIGTLASCPLCKASNKWLGKCSPIEKIRFGKLWLVQHLNANALNDQDNKTILDAIVTHQKAH